MQIVDNVKCPRNVELIKPFIKITTISIFHFKKFGEIKKKIVFLIMTPGTS